MIQLNEEDMLKTEIGLKLGLWPQMISQAVNAEEKLFKEIKSASAVNIWTIHWHISLT